ncbi:MAG TPA: preprotein translocase subunit SecG [Candidatus Monoglobus merdigallinarum]|uniref:Protein-export membrane protein SecG n=1 Tax=Candidatus Monoglobus merdigallinarum TaxID=2838698 RepID=A0A9D1PPR6_9FIRM|nr:preprotein translocase subunit SecG [Candidatus Monoglobus merdigallinarum]
MQTALVIIHVIIALVLTVIVLMQHGKQQGLSGAIAGGAETFFGKNKGRTIDAILKKFTAVFAILFIVSSVVLTIVSVNQYSAQNTDTSAEQGINVTMDENGNLVDEEGNIVMSAEDYAAAEAEAAAGDTADGTDAAADTTTDGAAADTTTADGAADTAADAAADGAAAGDTAADAAADSAADAAADTADTAAGESAAE